MARRDRQRCGLCLSGDREGGHGDKESQPAHAGRVSAAEDYPVGCSS
jgi:hypothetical protein